MNAIVLILPEILIFSIILIDLIQDKNKMVKPYKHFQRQGALKKGPTVAACSILIACLVVGMI